MPELVTPLWLMAVLGLSGYVLGSIAFGPLVARAMGLGDLRALGSGNIGATNVLRTGNRWAAALTLLLDAGKGAVAVVLALAVAGRDGAQVAGLAAFLGHLFPVFLAFRGGKGVATWLGVALALAWPAGVAACALWAGVFALTRISSASALVAAALAPAAAWATGQGSAVVVLTVMGALIFWTHRANIARLRAGTEPRFGRG